MSIINTLRALRIQPSAAVLRSLSSTPVALKIDKATEAKLTAASIPLPPKRPASSYGIFFTELFPTIRNDFLNEEGAVKAHEVAKEAGKRWTALSDADKKPYIERFKSDSETYHKAYKRYYESLTSDQIDTLNKVLARPLPLPIGAVGAGATRGEQKRARREASGEPPKGLSGFIKFMEEFRNGEELKRMIKEEGIENGQKAQIFAAKKGGEKWNMMSDKEKEVSFPSPWPTVLLRSMTDSNFESVFGSTTRPWTPTNVVHTPNGCRARRPASDSKIGQRAWHFGMRGREEPFSPFLSLVYV